METSGGVFDKGLEDSMVISGTGDSEDLTGAMVMSGGDLTVAMAISGGDFTGECVNILKQKQRKMI